MNPVITTREEEELLCSVDMLIVRARLQLVCSNSRPSAALALRLARQKLDRLITSMESPP